MKSRIKTIVLITIAVLITITASQNLTDTKIQILLWDLQAPLILIILFSLVAGFIVGFLFKGMRSMRTVKKEKNFEKNEKSESGKKKKLK